jgi:hypothetical protein
VLSALWYAQNAALGLWLIVQALAAIVKWAQAWSMAV